MSRVTIDELGNDYMLNVHYKEADKISDVEIVPRKMVEKIIEKCERMMDFYTCDTEFTRGKKWAYDDIRAYAESLLMEFEEDDE